MLPLLTFSVANFASIITIKSMETVIYFTKSEKFVEIEYILEGKVLNFH